MKKAIIAAALVLSMAMLAGAMSVYGDSDITNDPLVSLSYINEVLWPKIEKAISDAVSEKPSQDEDTVTGDAEDNDKNHATGETDASNDAETDGSLEYEVLHLYESDIITSESACEIILRSGSAAAYLDGNESGIADLTDGGELFEGDPAAANHLLIIPRGDGRGLKITSAEAFIMVRGGYNIVEN